MTDHDRVFPSLYTYVYGVTASDKLFGSLSIQPATCLCCRRMEMVAVFHMRRAEVRLKTIKARAMNRRSFGLMASSLRFAPMAEVWQGFLLVLPCFVCPALEFFR